jgi:transcriptional regulator with XRE-family HTH domain
MSTPRKIGQVIRRVRQRLSLSQEGLARLLNATKGAVQHWERGRNNPDLARLLALRQLCPRGRERAQLDALVRQTLTQAAPWEVETASLVAREPRQTPGAGRAFAASARDELRLLRRRRNGLQRQVVKLQYILQERDEQLRILQNLTTELQRELASLRTSVGGQV